MGACWQYLQAPPVTEEKLRSDYELAQAALREDEGDDMYAGHLGIKQGLKVYAKTFSNAHDAECWLMDHTEKWGPAAAVRFYDKDSEVHWLIGGWCPE